MGWIYFAIIIWGATLLSVPLSEWKKYWPVGALPLSYWVSYFPGGILFAHFRPEKNSHKVPYILVTAFLLLAAELILMFFGYFKHLNWDAFKSYILNCLGFIVVYWLSQIIDSRETKRART